MLIDCDTCAVRGPACGDCVVTVLLGAPPAMSHHGAAPDAVELDGAEQAAIAVLAGSGLVPPLRLLPSADADRHWSRRRDDDSPARPQGRAVGL
jgi:hypothetical protein